MINCLWIIMMVFSFLCAAVTGNMGNMSSAIISSGSNTITLLLKLTGIICLWNGLCTVAEKSGLTKKTGKLLSPVLGLIFPKLKDEKTLNSIAMNITANLFGLGNVATPLGLEAMKRLQKTNPTPQIASDDMIKFVVMNSAAVHLVPTTVALLRKEYGSISPTEIILPSLIASFCAVCVGLIATSVLKRVFSLWTH